MSSAALPFKAWLVQPGNHRLLQSIQQSLTAFLARDVSIKSWPDLYTAFEDSVIKSEDARNIFNPIFSTHPPLIENGATHRQLMLYRGAKVTVDGNDALPAGHKVTVTYRGQTIEKVVQDPASVQPAEPPKTVRYYRGIKVEE